MIPIATFRANVLAPVLGHIRSRGLAGQIDMVVFSTDFPNKVDATLEAGGPIGASLPRCSLTSAMAFGDLIEINHEVNTASTNSAATKGRKSSMPSPTPI